MAIESESTHRETKRIKKTHQSPIPAEDSQPLPNLPQEIIVEILSRLAVKPLLQFRSVCKSWCSLISNPQFVKTHLSIASKSDDYTSQRLILSSIYPHFDLKSCSLYSVLYEQSDNAIELDYPLKDPHRSVWIVGSCNGLVCIAIEEDSVFLWNPSTRKSKRLPNSGIRMRYGCFIIYGFGYDESIDDYKVVGIFCVVGCGGSYENEVKVYTLRTDSWRRIEDFPYGIPLDDSGKFANGVLHWAASGNTDSSHSWVIVSLDLAKETYGEVVQPNYGDGGFDLTLGVLRGCLCVLCNFRGTRADLWVMNEYGMSESWIKSFAIPYLTDPGNYEYSPPLCISKNGEILLEFGSGLVLFNPKDGTFRNPTIHNLCTCLEADSYVESLVSPSADNVLQSMEIYVRLLAKHYRSTNHFLSSNQSPIHVPSIVSRLFLFVERTTEDPRGIRICQLSHSSRSNRGGSISCHNWHGDPRLKAPKPNPLLATVDGRIYALAGVVNLEKYNNFESLDLEPLFESV